MTLAPLDFLSGTVCQLTPGVQEWGPGWYLIADNTRVEAGPFPDALAASRAAAWMDDTGAGVHPGPWVPRWSGSGLLIGSRIRERRGRITEDLAPTG